MISVILPTYNESANIVGMVNSLFENCPQGQSMEVIVVDDDSKDGTGDLVDNLKNPNVKLIRRTRVRGLASAFNRGIIESRGDFICWMDADMCMPAAMIPKMYSKIVNDGYDAAIGSRYCEGGQDDRSYLRVTSSKFINWLAQVVLKHNIKDCDSGFIMIRRQVLDHVTIIPIGYGEYFIEFVYNMVQRGLKVAEIGYYFRDRFEDQGASKSFPNIFSFLLTGSHYILRIFLARFRLRI